MRRLLVVVAATLVTVAFFVPWVTFSGDTSKIAIALQGSSVIMGIQLAIGGAQNALGLTFIQAQPALLLSLAGAAISVYWAWKGGYEAWKYATAGAVMALSIPALYLVQGGTQMPLLGIQNGPGAYLAAGAALVLAGASYGLKMEGRPNKRREWPEWLDQSR